MKRLSRRIKREFIPPLLGAACFLAGSANLCADDGPPGYRVIDLGTFGGNLSQGNSINNRGEVAGSSRTPATNRAFIYSGGVMRDFGASNFAIGFDVNDAGAITGNSYFPEKNNGYHAFLYWAGGLLDLGTFGGTLSVGRGVNNLGQVTGSAEIPGEPYHSPQHAFVYSDGVLTDIGTLGGSRSVGQDINDAGQVTGYSDVVGDSASRAFLYASGRMIDLGTLGGTRSAGIGINNRGEIAGDAYLSGDTTQHAFLYSNGTMFDLGTLGGNSSHVYSLNKSDQLVGVSQTASGAFRPFLYHRGTMYDFIGLIVPDAGPTGDASAMTLHSINDWGQIAGSIGPIGFEYHAALFNPVAPLTRVEAGTQNVKFIGGMNYNLFASFSNTEGRHTTVRLLDGAAGVNRDVKAQFLVASRELASDAIDLTGTGRDAVVIELTYDEARAAELGREQETLLGWRDPADGTWKNAVLGNNEGSPTMINGPYNPDLHFHIGFHGLDLTRNTVWAVVDHSGLFGVISSNVVAPSHLTNISTRSILRSDNKEVVGGFIITGAPCRVIIRGTGPSLSGVGATLQDPTLELRQGRATIAANDNWKDTQQSEIEATGIPPINDLESAIVATLDPGAYTAILSGKNPSSGLGLVEVYDLGSAANSELANISTRGFVDTGDNAMIGGFIIGGVNDAGGKVLVRALGPSLTSQGVTTALANPTLDVHNSNGATIATNDNWKETQQVEIEATTIPPTNDLESAVVRTLAPGNYTAIVRGKNGSNGVGLVEVYNVH